MTRYLLTLAAALACSCASELRKPPQTLSSSAAFDAGAPTPPGVIGPDRTRAFGLELSTRVRQPECLDTPDRERNQRKCICGWGSTCLCRVKVRQRADNTCLVQSMTEYEEGVPKVREPDGRVRAVDGVHVERSNWSRDSELDAGSSISVCGLTITCVLQ